MDFVFTEMVCYGLYSCLYEEKLPEKIILKEAGYWRLLCVSIFTEHLVKV